jgi:hypothetical protein
MFCSEVKVSAALRLYRAAVGTIWEASKLGGLNIKKCLQPRKTLRGKIVFAGEAGKPTHFLCWGRPMPWRKKQVNALREPAVVRGQASDTIVDVRCRRFIPTLTLGFLGDAGEIDFPIPGPGRIGVIGNHGWSPLRQRTHWKGQQNERCEPSMVEVHVVADFFEFNSSKPMQVRLHVQSASAFHAARP